MDNFVRFNQNEENLLEKPVLTTKVISRPHFEVVQLQQPLPLPPSISWY